MKFFPAKTHLRTLITHKIIIKVIVQHNKSELWEGGRNGVIRGGLGRSTCGVVKNKQCIKNPAKTHLSTLMTHKVMMDAVQHMTSIPMKTLQKASPNSHFPPVRSVAMAKGMTPRATDRSAAASDTSK